MGLFQETLSYLKRALNFSTVDMVSADGNWGAHVNNNDSTYNGMVGMLERREVDISSAR